MKFLSITVFLAFCFTCQAQNSDGVKLDVKNSFWGFGYEYFQDGTKVSKTEFEKNRKSQLSAQEIDLYNSGKSLSDAGKVIGNIGGFVLGYQIGVALTGGDANSSIWYISGGATLVGVILDIAGLNKMKKVLSSNYSGFSVLPVIAPQQVGVGLAFNF